MVMANAKSLPQPLVRISQKLHKITPSGAQLPAIGHPDQSALGVCAIPYGGKNLSNQLCIEIIVEGHEGHDVELITEGTSFSKVCQVLLHVIKVDCLGLQKQVLPSLDPIKVH